MKIFLFALLFVFKASLGTAQSLILDSLKHALNIAKEDTNKVKLLIDLSSRYTYSYADTSLMYAEQALELAQKLNNEPGIRYAQGQMSNALLTLGNYPLALEYAFKVLPWAEKYGSNDQKAWANIGIAMCYRELGDYKNSLVYCRKGLAISETIKPAKFDHASIWGMVASVYEKNNQPDSAILYAKKAYKLVNEWSGILYVLGSAYSKKNNYDSAMFYYRAGLTIAVKNHTEKDLIDIYNGIAIVQKAKGNTDSVAWYAKKAFAEKVGKTYPLGLLQSANLLVDLYQSQNKTDSILKYLRVSISLKDSLFNREKTISIQNLAFKEEQKQKEIAASKLKYKNRYKLYSLLGILFTVLSITVVLYRSNRSSKKANELLKKQKEEIGEQKKFVEKTLVELKATQSQLIQSEKMASLGELTAGIAHEIQNPLNFVNNFSEVSNELIDEINEELDKGDVVEARVIASDIKQNLEKILHHGKRADGIVKGMLQHSRSSSGVKEPTDINKLADEYLRLTYHGLKANDKSFNATMKSDLDPSIGKINVTPQEMGRVLMNLLNNAFYAVNEKRKLNIDGYEPTVTVSTKKLKDKVEIKVSDNGNGIPQSLLDKIFQPFFTTKPSGEGTGLGLSLSYDIVTKGHGGGLKVDTKEGEYTTFIIDLPV